MSVVLTDDGWKLAVSAAYLGTQGFVSLAEPQPKDRNRDEQDQDVEFHIGQYFACSDGADPSLPFTLWHMPDGHKPPTLVGAFAAPHDALGACNAKGQPTIPRPYQAPASTLDRLYDDYGFDEFDPKRKAHSK